MTKIITRRIKLKRKIEVNPLKIERVVNVKAVKIDYQNGIKQLDKGRVLIKKSLNIE